MPWAVLWLLLVPASDLLCFWMDPLNEMTRKMWVVFTVVMAASLTLWLAAPRHSRHTISLPTPLREEVR